MGENQMCKKHGVPYEDAECGRCGGHGYTDWDIEEMENPLSFHNGDCFQCRGSGVLPNWECPICEEEHQYELERELSEEST